MRNAECGVRNAECGVGSGECGVGSAECGVRSAECGVPGGGVRARTKFVPNCPYSDRFICEMLMLKRGLQVKAIAHGMVARPMHGPCPRGADVCVRAMRSKGQPKLTHSDVRAPSRFCPVRES